MTTESKTSSGRPDGAADAKALKKKNESKNAKAKKSAEAVETPGFFERAATFFSEAKAELLRVVWPSRSETIKSTGVLLVLVAIAAIYLGLVDRFLNFLLKLVIS